MPKTATWTKCQGHREGERTYMVVGFKEDGFQISHKRRALDWEGCWSGDISGNSLSKGTAVGEAGACLGTHPQVSPAGVLGECGSCRGWAEQVSQAVGNLQCHSRGCAPGSLRNEGEWRRRKKSAELNSSFLLEPSYLLTMKTSFLNVPVGGVMS